MFKSFLDFKHPELKELKGPKPLFGLGNALELARTKPWDLVDKYHESYGKVFKAWLGPRPIVFMFDASGAEQIFEEKRIDYIKEMPTSALIPSLSENAMFLNNGRRWQFNHDNNFMKSPRLGAVLESGFSTLIEKIPHLIEKQSLNEIRYSSPLLYWKRDT
jgi:hypothetical protein